MTEELENYSDFKVNNIKFEDYFEAKAYKQQLLNRDESVAFSGFDKRCGHRVNFYLYIKNIQISKCIAYNQYEQYKNWQKNTSV